jgi:hypothetical protein
VTLSDAAIVFATLAGPVLAVQAQKWVERASMRKRRRVWIFETLMATRATTLAQNHVEALNSISLAFYGSEKGIREIVEAWKEYLRHLNDTSMISTDPGVWGAKRTDLFVDLMHEMSKFLGYKFTKVELRQEVYLPKAHWDWEADQAEIRRGTIAMLKGEVVFPVHIVGVPDEGMQAAQPALPEGKRGG